MNCVKFLRTPLATGSDTAKRFESGTKPFLGKQILKKLLSEASPITAFCFYLTFTMKYNNTMVVI